MRTLLTVLTMTMLAANAGLGQHAKGYPITPVEFHHVTLADGFWAKRLETNRAVTIPHCFQQSEETGRIRNFEIADSINKGEIVQGKFCTRYGFDDSDVFKIIEAAAYTMHTHPDPKLDEYVDRLVSRIAGAQEKDGYLYTMRTINAEASWAKERWVNARMKSSHEFYNLGHLYEAAVAYVRATGKRTLLDVAVKSADLLLRTIGPDKLRTTSGHQEIEIGLVKLFDVTGTREYLELAKFFIDERGRDPKGETYNQDQQPVIEQTEAVGHSVRAGYMYAGMADLAVEMGQDEYVRALDRFWEDVVTRKLYITGGVGAVGTIEGFGPPYVLPNLSAYCETCASIANAMWNYRMFLLHGDAKYLDILERIIYNGFLSGVGMSGDRFFYPNPLESLRGANRQPWFTCACCPPNVARFIPSISGYIYAHHEDTLFVNLLVAASCAVPMKTYTVKVVQETRYPWEGSVRIALEPERSGEFTVAIRIPGWAVGEAVAGGLYRNEAGGGEYEVGSMEGGVEKGQGRREKAVGVRVNGKGVEFAVERGFARVKQVWKKGDTLELDLPMQVRRVVADERVEDNRGKIALERGPIVFCLEGADNVDGKVVNLIIPDTTVLRSEFRSDLLGGVQVIRGTAMSTRRALDGEVKVEGPQEFTAIPYYAWAHRGNHQMTVWPAREGGASKPLPAPTLSYRSKVTVSGGQRPDVLNDQLEPRRSFDESLLPFHWWPKKGTLEWVQYDFPEKSTVSKVSVYWFDDTGVGETRLPKSWRVVYRDGSEWKPLPGASPAVVEKDRFNTLTCTPVQAEGVRVEVQLQEGFSAGMHEVVVE